MEKLAWYQLSVMIIFAVAFELLDYMDWRIFAFASVAVALQFVAVFFANKFNSKG